MKAPEGLAATVAEMRALGVSRLRTAEYELELGDAPPVAAQAAPAETEDARLKRIKDEYEADLYASSN